MQNYIIKKKIYSKLDNFTIILFNNKHVLAAELKNWGSFAQAKNEFIIYISLFEIFLMVFENRQYYMKTDVDENLRKLMTEKFINITM